MDIFLSTHFTIELILEASFSHTRSHTIKERKIKKNVTYNQVYKCKKA